MSPYYPQAYFKNGEKERKQGKGYSVRFEVLDDDSHISRRIESRDNPDWSRTNARLKPEIDRRQRGLSMCSIDVEVGSRSPSSYFDLPRADRGKDVSEIYNTRPHTYYHQKAPIRVDPNDLYSSKHEADDYRTKNDLSERFAQQMLLKDHEVHCYPHKCAPQRPYRTRSTQTEPVKYAPSFKTATPPPTEAKYAAKDHPLMDLTEDFHDGFAAGCRVTAAGLQAANENRDRESRRVHDAYYDYYGHGEREHREPRRRSKSRHREHRHRDARRHRSPSPRRPRGHREHRQR
ncbi:hypothetical protein F5B20DRAFT_586896 [Whalleya microplaca]|nr:hypothetical protein F5B20DRAFT_586896 [Whalleya microplaca]